MGKRDYAIIVLACTTGIRAGDIINIRISDIDWKNKEIVIIQGKNNSYLKLPLNDNICGALADYVLNGRPCTKSDKLFIRSLAPFQGFNSGVSINNILRRRAMNAGVTVGGKNTIHGIRRMVATEMIKANQSVYTVSQILGHQSLKSTRQYIDLDVEGLRKCTLCFNDVIVMNDEVLSEYTDDYLEYRSSLGLDIRNPGYYIKDFSRYLRNTYPNEIIITKEMVFPWCITRSNEKAIVSKKTRMSNLRQFTIFVYSLGVCEFILDTSFTPKQNDMFRIFSLTRNLATYLI